MTFSNALYRSIVVATLSFTMACSTPVPPSPFVFAPESEWTGFDGNATRLAYYRKAESDFYRTRHDLPMPLSA